MEFLTGAQYEGEWLDNLPCGIGKMIDGDVYEGGWVLGKRDGDGVCVYACGDRYEGQWKNNVPHGKGFVFIY